ncbi:MAG: hypothetical protein ACRD8O_19280 [Bryobacteraceae bacterium]
MNRFEDELKDMLRPVEPPEGFAGRVMERVRRRPSRFAVIRTRWLPAAIAACLLVVFGNYQYQRRQGEKAKEQLLLALEITGSKLHVVERKVSELSRRPIHE